MSTTFSKLSQDHKSLESADLPKSFPRRLIEVDLPIKRISEHARREKDMRRAHVPLLFIWPATRPPAACRAIICAALWPDPADDQCSELFRSDARKLMSVWASERLGLLGPESYDRFVAFQRDRDKLRDNVNLRYALLDFIADFSKWENSSRVEYLETARALTQSAHEATGGLAGTKPLVVDPFAGGGAIPLESLRIGADAYGSDLNPVAALFNRVVLEYIPKYGQRLTEEIIRWGQWAQDQAKAELSRYYPADSDGSVAIAYLFARWIVCEGPGCGAEVPLLRGLWLARKGNAVALHLITNSENKRIDFKIWNNPKPKEVGQGTIRRGSATCPICGYTTPVESVRKQLRTRHGGTSDARLFCVVTTNPKRDGRSYRTPTESDIRAIYAAREELARLEQNNGGPLSLVPNEPLPPQGTLGFRVQLYGIEKWGDLFTPRQALALITYSKLAQQFPAARKYQDPDFRNAVTSTLALAINRLADLNASLCAWQLSTPNTAHVFVRWALPMIMDFGEVNPLAGAGGSPESVIRRVTAGIEGITGGIQNAGTAGTGSATAIALPDSCARAFITDPPYYDAVPYADLSDFFYVWLKRTLPSSCPISFKNQLSPKEEECIVDPIKRKDRKYFETTIKQSMLEGRRILSPEGIGVVVFAHKSTEGWEAQLQAIIDAGWAVTASWPIDTEMESRMRAKNSAVLASSIHIVCRPRLQSNTVEAQAVGDWRDVLDLLPKRISEWMPRLAQEGIVGADAIFACLGPALQIFSQYERVEKASGDNVSLKEYLTYVWAAVAREALKMVFKGIDASGFEEDARLTAMWFWTLSAATNGAEELGDEDEPPDEDQASPSVAPKGYMLEYDAARKISQGLGAHLESLSSLVEIKGETARLLSVAERTRKLFGNQETTAASAARKKKVPQLQLGFDEELAQAEELGTWGSKGGPELGMTVLDRVHQSMILFGANRGEALRRFLVDEGAGKDERFWRLAQVLSYLYPKSSDEKRWIDGVLGRKKGLGL